MPSSRKVDDWWMTLETPRERPPHQRPMRTRGPYSSSRWSRVVRKPYPTLYGMPHYNVRSERRMDPLVAATRVLSVLDELEGELVELACGLVNVPSPPGY